jgi:hypothetical protein
MVTSSEQLTFFAAASHASLSVWPGSRQANQMTVTSGLRLLESLPSCDRELWWLRTLLGSSVWHSTRCLLIWKHKVTPQGRSYYLLRVSMPRTGETASGLWPTPRAEMPDTLSVAPSYTDGRHGWAQGPAVGRVMLHTPTSTANQDAPSMRERDAGSWFLPTPRHEGFDAGGHRGKPDSLHSHAKMFPTPDASLRAHEGNVRLYRAMVEAGEMSEDEAAAILGKSVWDAQGKIPAMLPTPKARDFRSAEGEAGIRRESPDLNVVAAYGTGMKLNPDWVARMMGLPDGYLDV